MQRNRKARLQGGVNDGVGKSDIPTPQTVRKLRQDVLRRLVARGRLNSRHIGIAEEIRTVHEAVGRGMFPTSQSLLWGGRTGNRPQSRDFLDRMTDAERIAWQRRYLPWSHKLATEIAAGLAGTGWLQLIIDIVVDNASLREIEKRYRLRHGTALRYLTAGLEQYDVQC